MRRSPEELANSITADGSESGILMRSFRDMVERKLREQIEPIAKARVDELVDEAVKAAMTDFTGSIQSVVDRNFDTGDLVMHVVMTDKRGAK